MIVVSYDNIPAEDKPLYRISGWRIDGEKKTNVTQKANGKNAPVWPVDVDGSWSPSWTVVE